MDFRHELTYAAKRDAVYSMLANANFREEVCAYQQVLHFAVSVDEGPESVTVDVTQVQAAHGVASFAAKFVGNEIAIERRETWRPPSEAELEITIPGKPARLRGAIALREDQAGRTVETVSGQITVAIPLIGGKLEALVADLFRAALDAEHTVGTSWLGQ